MIRTFLACCLVAFGLATSCRAETYPGLARVIEQTARLVEDQFVDAATARRTADEIRRRQTDHQYDDIQTAEQLQRRLTDDLRAISGDTHIGVVEDRAAVARYRARAAATPSPEDAEAQRAAAEESRLDNYGLRAVEVLPGGVGYLRIDYFDSLVEQGAPAIAAAMNMLAGSDAVIIDLRRNGGGSSKALPLYLGYFLGPETVAFAIRRERWRGQEEILTTRSDVAGARHYNKPIYILTSGTTYSLAEQFTYHLKALSSSVVIIGERTYGGGNGWDPVVLNDDFYLRLPRVAFTNIKTGTIFPEGGGIAPDIAVDASTAKTRAYAEALDRLSTTFADPQKRDQAQWGLAIAKARLSPAEACLAPTPEAFGGRFDALRFEARIDGLWLSFRDLPFVRLECLNDGLYLDDRSIQRQFRFTKPGPQGSSSSVETWEYGEEPVPTPRSSPAL